MSTGSDPDVENVMQSMRNAVMDFSDDDIEEVLASGGQMPTPEAPTPTDLTLTEKVAMLLDSATGKDLSLANSEIVNIPDHEVADMRITQKAEMFRGAARFGCVNILRAFVDSITVDILQDALRDACIYDKVESVEIILTRDHDLDLTDGEFHNIRVASSRRFKEVVKAFLRNPKMIGLMNAAADDAATNKKKKHTSVLHGLVDTACRDGNVDILEKIAEIRDADDVFTSTNNMPLRTAISCKQAEVVVFLLERPGVVAAVTPEQFDSIVKIVSPDVAASLHGLFGNLCGNNNSSLVLDQKVVVTTAVTAKVITRIFPLVGDAGNPDFHLIKRINITGSFLKGTVNLGSQQLYEFEGPDSGELTLTVNVPVFKTPGQICSIHITSDADAAGSVDVVYTADVVGSEVFSLTASQENKRLNKAYVQVVGGLIPFIRIERSQMITTFDSPPARFYEAYKGSGLYVADVV